MNVILIVADSLRSDTAYNSDCMPFLNDFIDKKCTKFLNSYTAAPWTLASNMSLLWGMYPRTLGVQDLSRNEIFSIMKNHPEFYSPKIHEGLSLASALHRRGYKTVARTGGGFLIDTFKLNDGFDSFKARDWIYLEEKEFMDTVQSLKEEPPFFFYSQDFDTHESYGAWERRNKHKDLIPRQKEGSFNSYKTSSSPAADVTLRREAIHYYGEAAFQYDMKLGKIFVFLEEYGYLDDTMVIFTSDHGEELWDKGWGAHSYSLYESVISVPLAVYYPGRVAATSEKLVSLIDIAPTILDVESYGDGINLLSDKSHDFIVSEVWTDKIWENLEPASFLALFNFTRKKAILAGEYKYILTNDEAEELYDLETDPQEGGDIKTFGCVNLELENFRKLNKEFEETHERRSRKWQKMES